MKTEMESVAVKLARIEEGIGHLKSDVRDIKQGMPPISKQLSDHDKQIALMKRDKHWERHIGNTVSGILGGAFFALVEWFRK